MNVIFLTLVRISDIEERGIYQGLMRKFRIEGHLVCVVIVADRAYYLHSTDSLVKILEGLSVDGYEMKRMAQEHYLV